MISSLKWSYCILCCTFRQLFWLKPFSASYSNTVWNKCADLNELRIVRIYVNNLRSLLICWLTLSPLTDKQKWKHLKASSQKTIQMNTFRRKRLLFTPLIQTETHWFKTVENGQRKATKIILNVLIPYIPNDVRHCHAPHHHHCLLRRDRQACHQTQFWAYHNNRTKISYSNILWLFQHSFLVMPVSGLLVAANFIPATSHWLKVDPFYDSTGSSWIRCTY